ncbi:hypothetical protein [Spirabiliibacterium falconis]|uniref:hypothetical protein n=1 Tax=Spirabiliibacterium falconis TaxID=572023 RepID=UPI001AAD1173|nr:hypothetical protein [Spirabiliibacterium falconis]MBE2894924.1 hypothetical protein [Spirabiliibacterium falconis]
MLNLLPWREKKLTQRTRKLTACYLLIMVLSVLTALGLQQQCKSMQDKLNHSRTTLSQLRSENQLQQQRINLLQNSQRSDKQSTLIADKVRFITFIRLLSQLALQQGKLTLAQLDASDPIQHLVIEGEQLSEQEFQQLQETLTQHWLAQDHHHTIKLADFNADQHGISFRLVSGESDG